MPLKTDARVQLNIKGARITREFLNLVRAAAERQGQTMADFAVDTLTAEAQRVLKGQEAAGAALPARPEDVADKLAGLLAEQEARQEARWRALRRGRWRR